jgi:hypothetical protein
MDFISFGSFPINVNCVLPKPISKLDVNYNYKFHYTVFLTYTLYNRPLKSTGNWKCQSEIILITISCRRKSIHRFSKALFKMEEHLDGVTFSVGKPWKLILYAAIRTRKHITKGKCDRSLYHGVRTSVNNNNAVGNNNSKNRSNQ